jgi:DNA-binding transcriptional LysR family regulator
MAALEQELGARLFDRSSRGMTLTDAGRTFLEHAKLVLADVERAVEAGLGHTILPLGAVAEEVAAGRLSAAPIDHPSIPRRVVCATNMARPTTPAAAAVVELVIEVIRGLVDSGAWPARWVGPGPVADRRVGSERDQEAD